LVTAPACLFARSSERKIMATYSWVGDDTGNWTDQSNWYDDSANMGEDGYPGAGDTAYVDATEVTVQGVTVANLYAFATDIVGNISVTGDIEGGVFSGGVVSAGTFVTGAFDGTSLKAHTIENGNFDDGLVTATLIVGAGIGGSTVTTASIDGQDGVNAGVSISSGSLTDTGGMTLDGDDILGAAGIFLIPARTPKSFRMGGRWYSKRRSRSRMMQPSRVSTTA
jgi:hypothetical protein